MPRIWVARLLISDRTARKIVQIHKMTVDEVRDAVEQRSGLAFRWDDDPDRGQRAIVQTQIRGRRALVVLYPAEDAMGDSWHLGSAYFV